MLKKGGLNESSSKNAKGELLYLLCASICDHGLYFQVGLLDVDLCGPSAALLMHVEDSAVVQSDYGWVPAKYVHAPPVLISDFFFFSWYSTFSRCWQ